MVARWVDKTAAGTVDYLVASKAALTGGPRVARLDDVTAGAKDVRSAVSLADGKVSMKAVSRVDPTVALLVACWVVTTAGAWAVRLVECSE
jgi:hypothetical protein